MQILLIGERTLFMDSVHKLLSVEDNFEIDRFSYQELQASSENNRFRKYKVAILDLLSLSEKYTKCVKFVRQQNVSDHLVVLHNDELEEFCESIYQAGADYCFSINSRTEELRSLVRSCFTSD